MSHRLNIPKLFPVFLFTICISSSCSVSWGAALTNDEVLAAVLTWVAHYDDWEDGKIQITNLEPLTGPNGETVAWVAYFYHKGFCICGADDLLLPVYYFSPEGIYNNDDPFLQTLTDNIATELNTLKRDTSLKVSTEIEQRALYWSNLIAGHFPESKGADRLELDFTPRWHQRSPYNDHCPELAPGEHTVVGCGPLSMAQLMYYWKWPENGEGSRCMEDVSRFSNEWISAYYYEDPGTSITNISVLDNRLTWENHYMKMRGHWDTTLRDYAQNHVCASSDYNCRATIDHLFSYLPEISQDHCADFSATSYNWDSMHDIHDANSTGNDEVAKLCYHSGIAMGAWWGLFGTFRSSVGSCINALETYFRFDSGAADTKPLDSNGTNIDYLKEEIRWSRPVIMCGSGHCFNVYGFDTSGPDPLLKINNGWGYTGGINQTGWYALDDAWPDNRQFSVKLYPENARFVQAGTVPAGNGTAANPYFGLDYAIYQSPPHSTLVLRAEQTHSIEVGVIDKPLVLRGKNVEITAAQ